MVTTLPSSSSLQHKKHQMVIAQVLVEALKYLHVILKGILYSHFDKMSEECLHWHAMHTRRCVSSYCWCWGLIGHFYISICFNSIELVLLVGNLLFAYET